MAITKQLPAGKSKAVTAAAKRKTAKSKDSSKSSSKSTPTKKVSARTAAPTAVGQPVSAVSTKAPVANKFGSLISKDTWEADQSRLQSASEDQDTLDSLNEAESDADSTYTKRTTEAARAAALRKVELSKEQDNFEKNKSTDYKEFDNNMAYRGATRSSAAERGTKDISTRHATLADDYKNAFTDVDTEVSDINTKAANEQAAVKARVLKRRGTLANRAAGRGVYSVGSDSEDGNVTAPGINDYEEAPVSKVSAPTTKVTPLPAIKVLSRGPKASNKKAKANTAAAKRRLAAKPKKKGK